VKHLMNRIGVLLVILLTGCISPYVERGDLPDFSSETADPGGSVLRAGKQVDLVEGNVDLHYALPDVELTDSKWMSFRFAKDGHVKIISVVPSIDTRICEQQTHLFSDTAAIDPRVERITLSRDLPSAQERFADESGMENVRFLSDYKSGEFGRASGLLMKDTDLLARAILVVDQNGVVKHLQIVPEMTRLPDIAKAVEVANGLVSAESL
jgi:thiol peroxidase